MEEFRFEQKAPVIQEILNSVANKSNKHHGDFNANDITEEGWYDSIVLGRPEGSESDERYFLYHSPNGGQVCFSRRNSGKVFERLGIGHEWRNVSYCDHSLEHATAMALNSYVFDARKNAARINIESTHTDEGYGYDEATDLIEYYAGDNGENNHFHIALPLVVKPQDIFKVRCTYRRGWSGAGVREYKYDSDAYIYLARSPYEGHIFDQLVSDFIKVKPLGGQHFPFTEEQQGWQDLAFLRDSFFLLGSTYGEHYIKVNVERRDTYYLHFVGDFSIPASWFVLDEIVQYNGVEPTPAVNPGQQNDGTINNNDNDSNS